MPYLLHLIPAAGCLVFAGSFAAMLFNDIKNGVVRPRSSDAMKITAVILLGGAGAAISILEVFL